MNKLRSLIFLQTFGLFISFAVQASQVPVIKAATVDGSVALLSGLHFGVKCNHCEVIADYKGFRYSLPVKQWSDRKIAVDYFDIGKGLISSVVVVGVGGTSKAVRLIGKAILVPPGQLGKFVDTAKHPDLKVHTRKYDDSIGGKGGDQFAVSSALPSCGQSGLVFEHADIVLGRHTRFGEAKIIASPAKNCRKCAPVRVGYYWEPTGKLEYQVHVYRRQVSGICRNRIRK